MADETGLHSPHQWYWHVALVFTIALAYALTTAGQIIIAGTLGFSAAAVYPTLVLTGVIAGLSAGMIIYRQCSSATQLYVATRNAALFPACFITWLVSTIQSMQAAAQSFALEHALQFSSPFGELVDPLAAGAIVLLSFDASATPFLLQYSGERPPLWRYEALIILTFLGFSFLLKFVAAQFG